MQSTELLMFLWYGTDTCGSGARWACFPKIHLVGALASNVAGDSSLKKRVQSDFSMLWGLVVPCEDASWQCGRVEVSQLLSSASSPCRGFQWRDVKIVVVLRWRRFS